MAARASTTRTAGSTAVAAVVGVVLLLAPPAEAARPSYVALGDSYSSGLGTRVYVDDGTMCRRSPYAYAARVATAEEWGLDLQACAGARIADVDELQLPALRRGTDYVTVSVGGNDAGFRRVVTACAKPWWAADCRGAVDRARRIIRRALPDALATLYADIRDRAPTSRVVVVGYPRLFDGIDCNALTWFSRREMRRLNVTTDLLNARTAAAATAAGFTFADPSRRFTDHAVCDEPEWVNGLSRPTAESYHPNRRGQRRGYAPLVRRLLTRT